jgi:ribosomal protein L7/L12
MTIKVHALFYGKPEGFFGASPTLQGLFETRELAEKRLLEHVLSGNAVIGARIDELAVEQPYDERNPLNYPDVIAALIEFKKIQAIKRLREHVSGMFLKEAKDAVEAVDLSKLPEDVRLAAIKLLDDQAAAERVKKEEADRLRRESRFEPVYDWAFYNFIRDGEGDLWGHTGDGDYALLNGVTGARDEFQELLTEDEIDSRYGIRSKTDEDPRV